MEYDDFAERFLAALYLETEEGGREYHAVRDLAEKYHLDFKPHWIDRIADDWEHFYFRDVSRVLNGYDSWSFRLSAEGARKVEADFRNEDEVRDFLGLRNPGSVQRNDEAIAVVVPASDRIVPLDHNSEAYQAAVARADELSSALATGNDVGNLTPEEVGVAAAEVDGLRRELSGNAVRASAFWDRSKSVLGWIAKEAAGAVVGVLALAVLAALAALLGFPVA